MEKRVFVFCVGGTGVRVMKSIIMLMAGGMDTKGYTVVPVVIDFHQTMPEKKKLDALIDNYIQLQSSSTKGFFGSNLCTYAELGNESNDSVPAPNNNEIFKDYIGLTSKNNLDGLNKLLVETLFSQKNLNSQLKVGFKGNPNMGTVALSKMIELSDWFKTFSTLCQDGDRIFIISSIFGGTGASGYPLLEKKIKESTSDTLRKALMGSITVLPYYGLKDPSKTGSDIDSANFYTKTKAALAYYQDTVQSDYLYYIGEKSFRASYTNDETKQDDKANFIEMVAASALFDFLGRQKPENTPEYVIRPIKKDDDVMTLDTLGASYKNIIKSVADFMLLRKLVSIIPEESFFPLKTNRNFNGNLFNSEGFKSLKDFTETYNNWYVELKNNKRSFAPLYDDTDKITKGWIRDTTLDGKDETYYLLEMIKSSNRLKNEEHSKELSFFLQFAYEAIDHFTNKIQSKDNE